MVTTERATTAIFYPESDGMPLPDGEYQSPLHENTVSPLRVHFRDVEGAHVNGNTFLYYVKEDPNTRVSPDCYVVFDLSEAALHSLSQEGNNTYLLWEVEKPPEFVLEIGSQSTWRNDLGNKRDLYADLGIGEYWRYDQTGGDFYREPLVGERLVGGEYQRLEIHREPDGSVWGHSDALNLDLWWTDGELRYWDPEQGVWLLTHQEDRDGRLAAEARADAERDARLAEAARAAEADARAAEADARAAEADARAAEADARAARLKAELRRLRGG